MTVLEAPQALEALVGLFGKLYVHTFDCATFYAKWAKHEKKSDENVHEPPLETRARITVFIFWVDTDCSEFFRNAVRVAMHGNIEKNDLKHHSESFMRQFLRWAVKVQQRLGEPQKLEKTKVLDE